MRVKHQLPKLNYGYNDLEPYIDAATMEIHHTKHHQAYIDKYIGALAEYPDWLDREVEDVLKNLDQVPDEARTLVRNQGGGYANHNLYWQNLGPKKEVNKELVNDIKIEFGRLDEFKKKFSDIANSHFASGWAWLVKDALGKLHTYSLPNQDSPLSQGHIPIIGFDLLEHAYYLKYQNRRAEYVQNWWQVLKLLP